MALMGENGAGKSTLVKIITGLYTKDSGTITLEGKEISPKTVLESQKLGIQTVYQELNWKGYTASARCLKCGEYTSRWAKMENQLVDEILFDMDTLTVCVA